MNCSMMVGLSCVGHQTWNKTAAFFLLAWSEPLCPTLTDTRDTVPWGLQYQSWLWTSADTSKMLDSRKPARQMNNRDKPLFSRWPFLCNNFKFLLLWEVFFLFWRVQMISEWKRATLQKQEDILCGQMLGWSDFLGRFTLNKQHQPKRKIFQC